MSVPQIDRRKVPIFPVGNPDSPVYHFTVPLHSRVLDQEASFNPEIPYAVINDVAEIWREDVLDYHSKKGNDMDNVERFLEERGKFEKSFGRYEGPFGHMGYGTMKNGFPRTFSIGGSCACMVMDQGVILSTHMVPEELNEFGIENEVFHVTMTQLECAASKSTEDSQFFEFLRENPPENPTRVPIVTATGSTYVQHNVDNVEQALLLRDWAIISQNEALKSL